MPSQCGQHAHSPLQGLILIAAIALVVVGVSACGSTLQASGPSPAASALSGSAPATTLVAPATLHPTAITFLSATRGVVAGQMVTDPAKTNGPNAIQLSSDGGATWRMVHRVNWPVTSLSAVAPDHVWALVTQGRKTGAPAQLLASSDGGATWASVGRRVPGLTGPVFASRTVGFALRLDDFAAKPEYAPWTLVKTTDGGRTWQSVARACPFGTTATAISFVDSSSGWQLRTRQPGAGQQLRELLATKDGGLHWRRVSGTLSPAGIATSLKDGLGIGGYPDSLFFLPDGHGWIGLNYAASIIATKNAGRTWRPAGTRLSDYGAGPVWFLDDRNGFAIAGSAVHFRLLRTRNGGRTWTTVHTWED